MQTIIKNIEKGINYILGFLLLVVFIFLTWNFIPPLIKHNYVNCSKRYLLKDKYYNLNKTHNWEIYDDPFIEIESYLNNTRDGILVNYNIDNNNQNLFINATSVRNNMWDGFSLGYKDGELNSIYYYKKGTKNGIYLTFHNRYPSLLVIYSNNKNIGLVNFWDYGRIRGIKFGSNYKDETRERGKDNDTYDNGQKAFEYLEDNGTKYWVVYNPKGKMLIKYPTDNDFCKAEFYENGKKVEIPYYFDKKEFEEIYEKIKNDVNQSNTQVMVDQGSQVRR